MVKIAEDVCDNILHKIENECIVILDLSRKNFTFAQLSKILSALSKNTSVKKIHLNRLALNPQEMLSLINLLSATLTTHPHIRVLTLDDNGLDASHLAALIDLLKVNQSIKHLNLVENEFNNHGSIDVLTRLIKETKLSTINLSINRFSSSELIEIIEALTTNKTITKFILEDNCLDSFDETVMQTFAKLLKKNFHLKTLSITGNRINNLGMAQFLHDGVNKNTTLKELKLDCQTNEMNVMHTLAHVLATTRSLKTFCISLQGEGNKEVVAFGNALGKNRSLTTFALDAKGPVISAIMSGLAKNETINTLSILTEIDASNIESLANYLKSTTILASLFIDTNNPWSKETVEIFTQACLVNQSLIKIEP